MDVGETGTVRAVKGTLLPHGRYLVTKATGERGLSVTALAATLGVSRKHLSNVLNAAVPLGEGLAERLALALDLDPGDLIILRHDGVIPPPLDSIKPMKIEILGDPNEPIPGWFED